MNNKLFFAAIFTIVSTACNAQQKNDPATAPKIDTAALSTKVDALVKQYTDPDIFSGVVLIAFDGKPVYHKPFGLANRETKTPVTLNTKFLIGSMNKTFTQVVVMQLVSEGKLHLDDKLIDFIPGFRQPLAKNITVDHLLNHRSGFADYHGPRYFNLPYNKKNIQGITELLKDRELDFPPGSDEQYSNAGYILLGAIIEKVTGKSYAANVNERIISKLNLKETYTENIASIPERSIGYLKTIYGVENNLNFITEPRSDGGFWSTSSDILTFYRNFFYGDQLLTETMKAPMRFFEYLRKLPPGKSLGMAGGMNGINTVHSEMPNEKISIVVLANMDEPVAEKMAGGIRQIITGQTPEPVALPVKLRLYNEYKSKGIEAVKNNFQSLTSDMEPDGPRDGALNMLGYELMQGGNIQEALEIFKLNTQLFPGIGNAWDSYGEALLKSGDKKAALAAYKKALSINPNIPSAKKAVEMLEK